MTPDADLSGFLIRAGLAQPSDRMEWISLGGGVSSDIWKVVLPERTIVVKRALPKLRVASDWTVPTSRNSYEWAWLREMHRVHPDSVPEPLAHDEAEGALAMAYLPPELFSLWKAQLLADVVEPTTAAAVGTRLATLHRSTAGDARLQAMFETSDLFFALRLEPYFLTTAKKHPALATALRALADTTAATRLAVVHGDVSPKNILVGPRGPLFLDAECAWYGDPAFDLAFCVALLLLKCVARPHTTAVRLGCIACLETAYLAGVDWEKPADLEARAAALLPGLLLARIDGKSPVEYITAEDQKDLVRSTAAELLRTQPRELATVSDAWRHSLEAVHRA